MLTVKYTPVALLILYLLIHIYPGTLKIMLAEIYLPEALLSLYPPPPSAVILLSTIILSPYSLLLKASGPRFLNFTITSDQLKTEM